MTNPQWIAHAYPLKQLTIKIQGTRHTQKASLIHELERVLDRLKAGDVSGTEHDDDYGHDFTYVAETPGPTFFG